MYYVELTSLNEMSAHEKNIAGKPPYVYFHPLLLPTFVVELLPVIDLLPTWTGCVALVVSRRKKQQAVSGVDVDDGKVIDIDAKRVE